MGGPKGPQGVARLPVALRGCGQGLTAGLDGAVIEGGAGVHGVAPGAVAVVIGVAAVVLLQARLGVGGGRDPAQGGSHHHRHHPQPQLCPRPHTPPAPSHTHWGTWGVWAAHGWQVMPLRVLLTWPR